MILFKDQWKMHPNAIVDVNCPNESFVRLAAIYKSMGIDNHMFILQLHNPALLGVDPFDPNLTMEQMVDVAVECKLNFWYYLRMCVRVPGSTDEDPIRFKANRGNIALFWLFFNHIMVILIQIRQTGKSFSTDVLMRYLLNIRCTNTQINLLTKDDTLRTSNLQRLKDIELELPFYLRQKTRADIGNTEKLTVKALNNSYEGHLPNKSPKMALNVGRGLTSPIFQIDEAAFFFNIAISMPAALAAGTAARDAARRRDEPYGTIITTTAGKKDDRDGAYVFNLLQNSAVWSEKFFDARNLEDLEHIVRSNSPKRELRVNCTFSHRQLGYTDAWLKRAIEESEAKGEAAERDFGNVWTSGGQLSPLSANLLDAIRASEVEDYYSEISNPHGYVTRWYLDGGEINRRMTQGHYVLSVDSSDAAGGDDIALTVRDIRTGGIVAAGNYNETNLITFSEWLCQWLERFVNLTLVIERRSSGATILDYLLLMLPSRNIDPFARIYNKAIQDADEFRDRFLEVTKPMFHRSQDIYVKYKKLFGFATSATGATSRSELYGTTLINAAKHTGSKVKDKKTIDHILGLVVRNGRVDHEVGEHDDLAISWVLGFWFMTLGKNLHCYGINSRDVLCDNVVKIQENCPVTLYNNMEQEYLRNEIEALVSVLSKERDPYMVSRLESKLKQLGSGLSEADRNVLSVDALIEKIREQKKSSFNWNRR